MSGVLVAVCFQEVKVSAAIFHTTEWQGLNPLKRLAYVNILYSYPYKVRAGTIFDVPVLLRYENELYFPAILKSIYVTNVIIRVRDSLIGPNLSSSLPDSSKVLLTPGAQYSHTFWVHAPSTPGPFYVLINFDVHGTHGYHYRYDSKRDLIQYRYWIGYFGYNLKPR